MIRGLFSLVLLMSLAACSPSKENSFVDSALLAPQESLGRSEVSFGNDLPTGYSSAVEQILKFGKAATDSSPSNVELVSADASFIIVSASLCNRSLVKATDICTVKVRFIKGKAAGTYTAQLKVGAEGAMNTVNLTATVLPPPEETAPSPGILSVKEGSVDLVSPVDFGSMNAKTSLSKIYTLSNQGASTLPLSVNLVPGTPGAFSISSQTCTASLLKGKSCSFKVKFDAPASVAANENHSAVLHVATGVSYNLQAQVLGTPVFVGSPDIRFYESSIERTSLLVGDISSGSVSKIITVKNVGTAPATGIPSFAGDAGLSVSSNTCSSALAVNQSCLIKVALTFAGNAPGSKSGSITYGSASLALSGSLQQTISYERTLSSYVPAIPSNLQPCDGPVTSSRTMTCRRSDTQAIVNNSNCAADAQASVVTHSPAGSIGPIALVSGNGSYVQTCAADAISGSVVITCDSGYHESDNACIQNELPAQKILVVTKGGLVNSGAADQSDISFNPAPTSKVAMTAMVTRGGGGSAYKYTFPMETTSVQVIPNLSAPIVLMNFEGDCSGLSCTLDFSSSQAHAVFMQVSDSSSKFQNLYKEQSRFANCYLPSTNTDVQIGSTAFEDTSECVNPNKNVYWQEDTTCRDQWDQNSCSNTENCSWREGMSHACDGFTDQMQCSDKMGCSWTYAERFCSDNMDENSCMMAGSCSWEPQMRDCSDFGGDEMACSANGCSYDSEMNNCSGMYADYSMGTCQGGTFQDYGNGSCSGSYNEESACVPQQGTQCKIVRQDADPESLYFVEDESSCNPAVLTGAPYYPYRSQDSLVAVSSPYMDLGNNKFSFISNGSAYVADKVSRLITKITAGWYSVMDSSGAYSGDKFYYVEQENGRKVIKAYSSASGTISIINAPGVTEALVSGKAELPNSYSFTSMIPASDGVFFATSTTGPSASKIWKIDNTGVLSKITDISGHIVQGVSVTNGFIVVTTSGGSNLYTVNKSNGSLNLVAQGGLSFVSVVNPANNSFVFQMGSYSMAAYDGSSPSSFFDGPYTTINSALPYYYNNNLYFDWNRELYIAKEWGSTNTFYDSTLHKLRASGQSYPVIIGGIGGNVFVRSANDNGFSVSLWIIDSAGNRTRLHTSNQTNWAEQQKNYAGQHNRNTEGVELNGKLYFPYEQKLWETDGTALGTVMVPGLPSGSSVWSVTKSGNSLVIYGYSSLMGYGTTTFTP